MIQVSGNCLELRGWLVGHHAPLEEDRIALINGEFFNTRPERNISNLGSMGRKQEETNRILIAHGQISHTQPLPLKATNRHTPHRSRACSATYRRDYSVSESHPAVRDHGSQLSRLHGAGKSR